jgi:hypothetical protein
MPFHLSGHKPHQVKHFESGRFVRAIIGGVVVALLFVLATAYKKSIPLNVSGILTPGLGGSYCGSVVWLKGKVLLSNSKPSTYWLEDLKDSVSIEIVSGKGTSLPSSGQIVEVQGTATCRWFGYPVLDGGVRVVPSFIDELSRSVVR